MNNLSYQGSIPISPLIQYSLITDTTNLTGVNKFNTASGNFSSWKNTVRVATTQSLNQLKGFLTIDGITVQNGDRVLVKDQVDSNVNLNNSLNNGIYIVGQSWIRADDMLIGSKPGGSIIYIKEGISNSDTFYFCTNDFSSITGTNKLFFNPLKGIISGEQNSIIYNEPLNSFNTSSAFTYDDDNTTLTLGYPSLKSIISSKGGVNSSNNTLLLYPNTNTTAGTNMYILSGERGDPLTSTLLPNDGNIIISSASESYTTFMPKSINFTTSASPGVSGDSGSINITSGINSVINMTAYRNAYSGAGDGGSNIVFRSSNEINITTNDIPITFKDGGIDFTNKNTITGPLSTPPTINEKQGLIHITNPNTITANNSVDYVVTNNTVLSTSIILTSIQRYDGTGVPVVNVKSISAGSFTLTIANISSTNLSVGSYGLRINFIVF